MAAVREARNDFRSTANERLEKTVWTGHLVGLLGICRKDFPKQFKISVAILSPMRLVPSNVSSHAMHDSHAIDDGLIYNNKILI
jgi:hypothetical protein